MRVNIDRVRKEARESTSSKGNQNKWYDKRYWYKEDGLGYEALSEVVISRLLEKTNVDTHVCYEYVELEKGNFLSHGCKSAHFLTEEDDKIISLERIFQIYTGESLTKAVLKYPDVGDRILYVAENTERYTGLTAFGHYLKKIITVDALFLNEDRHFHNLAVIQRKDGSFRECPIFDNGAGLFSDVRNDYPLEMSLEGCYEKIQAKPFSLSFDEQLDACDVLYGDCRFEADFTIKDVEHVLEEFRGIYADAVLERVKEVMRMQIRKYAYLF